MLCLRNTTPLLWYFLFSITLLRLLIAPHFGLGVDEAHYVLYGTNLDLSYFDHPPLVGWLQYLSISLFGISEFSARFFAIIIGLFSSIFIYNLLYSISQDNKIALIATLALNASFLFNALYVMLMPDTLLFLFVIPIVYSTIALLHNDSIKNWLILALLLGLAGLSKYTAILFLVPILIFFIIKKKYHYFKSFKLIPSITVALLMISPVIFWNIQHDWISFSFQSEHVSGASTINMFGFFQSIAAQFGAYNPFLFVIAYYGLYQSLKSKNDYLLLSGLFALILILFFTYNSLFSRALPHWSALFYMLMIPIGSYYLLLLGAKAKKYLYFSIVFGLMISFVLYLELALKFIPQPNYQSLHRDLYGYETVLKHANKYISDSDNELLSTNNWSLASRIIYYNLKYNSHVALIDERYDQFDIWDNTLTQGKDLVFITTKFFPFQKERYRCDAIKVLPSIDITLHNNIVNTFHYTWCYNFQGMTFEK